MNNIKNIVFDLGGVIFNFDFAAANAVFSRLGVSFGGDNPHRGEVLALLNDYINGFVDEAEFTQRLLPYCAEGVTATNVIAELQTFAGDIPQSRLAALVALRKQYKVFLLSNINDSMWRWAVRIMNNHGYKPEDCFDATFLSYELQLAKPNAAIYQQMIAQADITPAETLYFDDLPENIEAGQAEGLCAHLVKQNALEECEAFRALMQKINIAD